MTNTNDDHVYAQLFVRNLAVEIPELKPILERHLDDNKDKVLPYVFLGAYAWPWFLSLFNSGTDQHLRLCRQYLAALEAELARQNEETTNVIGLEFLRWLVHGQREPIRAILPPLLREELERMENLDRGTAPVIELRAMLQQDPPSCWIAFRALGKSRDAAAIDLLIAEAQGPDEFRRRAAVEAIGQSPLGGTAVAEVRRLLADRSPFVVRSAIEAAARLRDSQSHGAVLAFLKDRDALTRHEAVRALDALWREDDFEALFGTMSKDPDDDTRKEAAWILRRHAPANSRILIERWRSGTLPRERVWACELIAQSGGPDDRPILETLLSDNDGHVRDAARRALAGLDKRTSGG